MGQFSALLKVAFHSLRYRSGGVLLTILAVGLSVFVLLGVEHVRQEARSSFASTVSGVDLIVGAKTGDINLLLLSVFRIGNATTNIDWETVEEIGAQEEVSWLVPISLGDSHRNFRVVGTTKDFFERYQFGSKQSLVFRDGAKFENHTQVVLGASVASQLAYDLGDSLIVSHGMADTSFTHHDQLPLTIVGILEESGTPVDNALFVSLETIEAIHLDEPHYGDQSSEHHESDHKDHGHHDEDEHHESDHKDHGHHNEDE
ncbi:MAG: ABC transporter permease, partial [Gammaproteobacteria bacterium TMED1]